MGVLRGRNPRCTRRTWRLDSGEVVEGVVGDGLASGYRVNRVVLFGVSYSRWRIFCCMAKINNP